MTFLRVCMYIYVNHEPHGISVFLFARTKFLIFKKMYTVLNSKKSIEYCCQILTFIEQLKITRNEPKLEFSYGNPFSDRAGQKWISVRKRDARSAAGSWQEIHSHPFTPSLIFESLFKSNKTP